VPTDSETIQSEIVLTSDRSPGPLISQFRSEVVPQPLLHIYIELCHVVTDDVIRFHYIDHMTLVQEFNLSQLIFE
jgi:hypothetical protein